MNGVTRKTASRKKRICSQPLSVMSELLRSHHRNDQVAEQGGADDEPDDGFHAHVSLTSSAGRRRSRNRCSRRKTVSTGRRTQHRAQATSLVGESGVGGIGRRQRHATAEAEAERGVEVPLV